MVSRPSRNLLKMKKLIQSKYINMQFFTVLLMLILTGAEVDLFIPSFPELQRVFNVSVSMVELAISLNIVAICISGLIVGSLGDKYGRKPIILIGLGLFIIGSLCCIFAPNFIFLLFGRILQGIGMSAPLVLSYLIIADMYSIKEQRDIMGILNGSKTIAMGFAPVIGSYVNLFFKWHGNFVILLLFGTLCFVMTAVSIPESKTNTKVSISLKGYIPLLKSKSALLHIAAICFMIQAYWSFLAISPIFYMGSLGVSLAHFGLYQGSLATTFGVVSLASPYLFRKFGQKACFYASIFMMLLFLITMSILVITENHNPLIITLTILLAVGGMIIPINIIYPIMLETVKDSKGKLSALAAAIRFTLTAISIQILSLLYDGSLFYIGVMTCVSILAGIVACYALLKSVNFLDAN